MIPVRPWTRLELITLAGVLALGIAVGWNLRFPDVLTGGDDLTNLLLARSIAQGTYRDLHLASTPLHAHYPPLMPLWIWLLVEVGGGTLAMVQAANLALLAMIAVMMADALRRLGEARLGVALAALLVFNPMLIRHAGTALAELLLLACSTAALYALLRSREAGARVGRWHAVAFLAGVAAFGAKTIGLATLGAVVVAIAMTHPRRGAILGFASLAVSGLWFGYVRFAQARGISYSYWDDLQMGSLGGGPQPMLARVLANGRAYLQDGLPETLGLSMVPGTAWDNLAWTAVLLPAGIAGAWSLRRQWSALPLLLVATVPILLVWPWAMPRLAVPLVPAGLGCLLVGSRHLGQRLGGSRGRAILAGLLSLALALSVTQAAWRHWRVMRTCPTDEIYSHPGRCTVPEERALVAAARVAGTILPDSAVVLTSKPHVVYWFSRRRTVPTRVVDRAPADALLDVLDHYGVTIVLLTHMHPTETGRLAALFEERCEAFAPLPGAPAGTVLLKRSDGTGQNACVAMQSFRSWRPPAA